MWSLRPAESPVQRPRHRNHTPGQTHAGMRIRLHPCRRRYYRRTMTFSKRLAVVATGCAAMLVLSVLPASAATKVVYDANGDGISGYDLTRTALHNAPRRITVRAHVNGLTLQRANVRFMFSPVSDPYVVFIAKTFLRRDGRQTPQNLYVAYEGLPGAVRRPCAVGATWNVKLDYVRVSVPQACIRDDAGSLRMSVGIDKPGTGISDNTRHVKVRRG